MKSIGSSKIGLVRQINEDRFYIEEPLYVVTDGMGGHIGGEIASTMAIDEIVSYINQASHMTADVLANAISEANKAICERVVHEEALKGMGTTAVIAYAYKNKLYWASIGDSRLYIFKNERLQRITTDHSMVQTLVESGKISEADMLSHPQRNLLTRAVGIEPELTVDNGVVDIEEGTKILLCSDGLTGYVGEEYIEGVFMKENKNERILEDLMTLAYNEGAKDNVTIIVGTL